MSDDEEIPHEFVCPIVQEIMKDPVMTSDGHTFERTAIAKWFSTHNTSPITRQRILDKKLIPNHSLRKLIADFRVRYPGAITKSIHSNRRSNAYGYWFLVSLGVIVTALVVVLYCMGLLFDNHGSLVLGQGLLFPTPERRALNYWGSFLSMKATFLPEIATRKAALLVADNVRSAEILVQRMKTNDAYLVNLGFHSDESAEVMRQLKSELQLEQEAARQLKESIEAKEKAIEEEKNMKLELNRKISEACNGVVESKKKLQEAERLFAEVHGERKRALLLPSNYSSFPQRVVGYFGMSFNTNVPITFPTATIISEGCARSDTFWSYWDLCAVPGLLFWISSHFWQPSETYDREAIKKKTQFFYWLLLPFYWCWNPYRAYNNGLLALTNDLTIVFRIFILISVCFFIFGATTYMFLKLSAYGVYQYYPFDPRCLRYLWFIMPAIGVTNPEFWCDFPKKDDIYGSVRIYR